MALPSPTATPLVGSGYGLVGTRPGSSGQTEFYNTQSGLGFSNPNDLSNFVNAQYGQSTTPDTVFQALAGGYTPTSAALGQVKNDLNSYQNNLYNTPDPSSQRQSSSITGSLGSAQSDYDKAMQEYNDLQTKLGALTAPNYQQAYNDLTTQQGIPQLNTDIGNIDAQRNDLPYVNRAASGNAGVETEGQLSADTAQKDVPLYVQQQNLINRLQLAQDFVNNSMKFKQMDADQARQSLTDAINTANQAISISKDHLDTLNTLQQQQQAQQKAAQQFAYDNRISTPFYEVGGTIYRTSDQKAYSTPDQFFADGGAQDFGNVQKVSAPVPTTEVNPGNTLVDANGKVIYQAPFKATGGGGGSGGSGGSITATEATTIGLNGYDAIFTQGSKEDNLLANGNDGFANPDTYNTLRADAISKGYSADSFDKEFSKYVNPADPQDYDGVGASIKQQAPSQPGLLKRIINRIF